jgi:hypothetical protein
MDPLLAIPRHCGASLSFEATCNVIERMHASLVRQRVGALEIVNGFVDGDDTVERVVLVIDPASGASFISQWVRA